MKPKNMYYSLTIPWLDVTNPLDHLGKLLSNKNDLEKRLRQKFSKALCMDKAAKKGRGHSK